VGRVCVGEVDTTNMKKSLLFFIAVLVIHFSRAQSSLDSLRMVLPIGHTDGINTAVFSPDGKYALTASGDKTARIYEVSSGKDLLVLSGHTDRVISAVFSPDGKYVLTASYDSTARIYDAASGQKVHELSGHTDRVNSAVFSPDGNYILTVCIDNTTRIYEMLSGKEPHLLPSSVRSAVFSPDGNYVLTASGDNTVRICEVLSGKELQVFSEDKEFVFSAAFSPDGKYVITAGSGHTTRIYEVSSGNEVQVLSGHADYVKSAVFSANGKYALTVEGNNTARIYEVSSGRELHLLTNDTWAASAVFSPDGKLVLTCSSDKTARIFEVSSGKELQVLSGHSDRVKSAEFSPDGKYVLTASYDHTARIYDAASGQKVHELSGHTNRVNSAVFSPDGNYVLTASSDSTVRIYGAAHDQEVRVLSRHTHYVRSAVFSPNGRYVLSANDRAAHIYELASEKELHDLSLQSNHINATVFSPDSKYILIASTSSNNSGFLRTHCARIFDIVSGNEIRILTGHTKKINSTVFSSDGKYVLTASNDRTARIFEFASGKEFRFLRGHEAVITSAVFSPDGNYALTSSGRGIARIYNLPSGKKNHKLLGHNDWVNSAVFSPDGKYALTASEDRTARIYEVLSGREVRVLSGHKKGVRSAVFSPNGKFVLTVSGDNTARIYEASSGKEVHVLSGHTYALTSAVFSPDGKHILTTGGDHQTILWDAATGKPIYERIQLEKDNYLVKLPNSPNYMCSKDASKMLHYVTPSLKVIGFDQLDPVYNRPDIVLDSIGKYFGGADEELVASYRLAWEKRVEKLGLKRELLATGEIAVPNAEIANAEQIEYENKDGMVILHIKANDQKYALQRYNVLVNEVPVYGSAGISIAGLNTKSWERTDTITLGKGRNKIQVSVMNELGLENFKYPTYVNYTPKGELASKTVFIGIGVNHFKESVRDLKYCVKDVQDLANEFASNQSLVDTLLLTDQEVTRENVLALRAYLLKNTTENDKVIISCSSHGLLDDSLNFYLAMHDVDFKNPKSRGLKYEELESLLDGIPARQKLLLLDACNSGENDKTELLKRELSSMELASTMNAELTAQIGTVKGVLMEIEEENQTNFRKMNELFVNVRNNTGSVIISAAGGQQSAHEAILVDGQIIENGAFTFSVLEYLKQREGNKMKVTELKQYAEKRVEEITEGKQKPTSRQETMEVDFFIWE